MRQGWKLIHSPAGRPLDPTANKAEAPFSTEQRYELYDTNSDPYEEKDLSGDQGSTFNDLLERLTAFQNRFTGGR